MFTDDGLRRLACTGRDISSHHQRADKLLEQSRSDSLTGLPNLRAFDEKLELEWRRMRREQTQLGLIMLDIDHFKKYNDRYGHPEGDRAIQDVAEVVRDTLRRAGDFVARYGGEEFVIVSPMSSLADVKALGNRLLNALAEKQIQHPDSPTGRLTMSVGAASLLPTSEQGPELLLEQADSALYDAKKNGRNRVVVAREIDADMFSEDDFQYGG
jgi:diguanylate cyclase (GGDEF)-like protein